MVLGIEFLLTHHVIPMPATSSLIIMGGDPCVVLVQNKELKETRLISTLQFKRGMKRQEPSFMVVLTRDEEGEEEDIPPTV